MPERPYRGLLEGPEADVPTKRKPRLQHSRLNPALPTGNELPVEKTFRDRDLRSPRSPRRSGTRQRHLGWRWEADPRGYSIPMQKRNKTAPMSNRLCHGSTNRSFG